MVLYREEKYILVAIERHTFWASRGTISGRKQLRKFQWN